MGWTNPFVLGAIVLDILLLGMLIQVAGQSHLNLGSDRIDGNQQINEEEHGTELEAVSSR